MYLCNTTIERLNYRNIMYTESIFNYKRRLTNNVSVGALHIGSSYPISLQSMCNTSTNDVKDSVAQTLRIAEAGGDIVRLTTQGTKEAENLGRIRAALRQQNANIPLVADVHFNAAVANVAAANCEKVRINPGNYVKGKNTEYSAKDWEDELNLIGQKLHTFIDICKEHHTAVRIGVNHGSLSPRILQKYGDTPEGLVVSVMEFLEFFEIDNFHDIVISVKSSNTRVMVYAVRLLVDRMNASNMHYPLHLGVTEAGDGEQARIKSAIGISSLLADGLGDTIRVSLSEDPEKEIPVALKIRDLIIGRQDHPHIEGEVAPNFNPYDYSRYTTQEVDGIGGKRPPVVIAKSTGHYNPQPDFINKVNLPDMHLVTYADLTDQLLIDLQQNSAQILLLESHHQNPVGEMRAFFHKLMANNVKCPVVIKRNYNETDLEMLQVKAASDLGPLFLDGFGDGIAISNTALYEHQQEEINSIAFGILQAARVRMTQTEYIACPSCGRTLYNIQDALAKVKAATSKFTNLKIGIMGCIVNGLGEMADADYGYIGAGPGRISIYRGHECIEKNIPEEKGVERLLALIESDQNNVS